jgi:hypothetical protein
MTKQDFLDRILDLNTQSVEVFKDMVDQIEEEPQPQTVTISIETLDTIVYEIVKNLSALGTDLVDSYDLSMYNNEVRLEDFDLDESEMEDIIRSVIKDNLDVNEN